jgi:hypothetical protein
MLAIAVVVPVSASAQAAGDEYNTVSVPTGGNGDTNPANVTPASGSDDDSGGGTSILLVALAAVAAVCAGFAAWRLRGSGDDDGDEPPQQRVAPSTGGSETS